MTGNETIVQARRAYVAGMMSTERFEWLVGKAVGCGDREYRDAVMDLPFPWEIDSAERTIRKEERSLNRFFR